MEHGAEDSGTRAALGSFAGAMGAQGTLSEQGAGMWLDRLFWRSRALSFSGALLSASASILSAQGGARPLFEWNGRIDREIQIAMRGREAWIQATSRTDNPRARPVVESVLPRNDGTVRANL